MSQQQRTQAPQAPAGDPLASKPSVSFVVEAMLDGFPIRAEIEHANANQLKGIIKRLRDIGATPPPAPAAAPSAGQAAGGPPICPVHQKPMKQKQKGGWWCTQKIGDGYCQEMAK